MRDDLTAVSIVYGSSCQDRDHAERPVRVSLALDIQVSSTVTGVVYSQNVFFSVSQLIPMSFLYAFKPNGTVTVGNGKAIVGTEDWQLVETGGARHACSAGFMGLLTLLVSQQTEGVFLASTANRHVRSSP